MSDDKYVKNVHNYKSVQCTPYHDFGYCHCEMDIKDRQITEIKLQLAEVTKERDESQNYFWEMYEHFKETLKEIKQLRGEE